MTPEEECPFYPKVDCTFESTEAFYQFLSSIAPSFRRADCFIDPIICIDRYRLRQAGKIQLIHAAPTDLRVIFGYRALCEIGQLLFKTNLSSKEPLEVYGFNYSENRVLRSNQFSLHKIQFANIQEFLACQPLSCMRAAYSSDYLWISLNTLMALGAEKGQGARTYLVPRYYTAKGEFSKHESPFTKPRFAEMYAEMKTFANNWGFTPESHNFERDTSFVSYPHDIVWKLDSARSWTETIDVNLLTPDCSALLVSQGVLCWFNEPALAAKSAPNFIGTAIAKYPLIGETVGFTHYLDALKGCSDKVSTDTLPHILDAYVEVMTKISFRDYLQIVKVWPSAEMGLLRIATTHYSKILATNKDLSCSEYLRYISSTIK